MRVPQRSFVVEFKSRSRQTKATKPDSIWGDADLKAAVRQVEEQSPHLFAQPADEPVADAAVLPPNVDPSFPTETSNDVAIGEPTLKLEIEDRARQPIERSPAESETEIVQDLKARGASDRPLRAKRPVPLNARATSAAETHGTFVSRADLIVLEAENQRLKALFRAKISAENAYLKERLLRFS